MVRKLERTPGPYDREKTIGQLINAAEPKTNIVQPLNLI